MVDPRWTRGLGEFRQEFLIFLTAVTTRSPAASSANEAVVNAMTSLFYKREQHIVYPISVQLAHLEHLRPMIPIALSVFRVLRHTLPSSLCTAGGSTDHVGCGLSFHFNG